MKWVLIVFILSTLIACNLNVKKVNYPQILKVNLSKVIEIPIEIMLKDITAKIPAEVTVKCNSSEETCRAVTGQLTIKGKYNGNNFASRPLPEQIKFGLNDPTVSKENIDFSIPELTDGQEFVFPKAAGNIYIQIKKDGKNNYPLAGKYDFALDITTKDSLLENLAPQNFSIFIPIGDFILPVENGIIAKAGQYPFKYLPHPRSIIKQVEFCKTDSANADKDNPPCDFLAKDTQEPFEHKITYAASDNGDHYYFLKVSETIGSNDPVISNVRKLKVNIK